MSAFSLAAKVAVKKLSKKKRREGYFALCGGRGGLRDLHLRKLLKKLDQNFNNKNAPLCGAFLVLFTFKLSFYHHVLDLHKSGKVSALVFFKLHLN